MGKNSQEEAEDQLDRELQAHLKAKEAQTEASSEYKAAQKEAKQAAREKIQRHYLLTHTNFNSWWEATTLVIFPLVAWALSSNRSLEHAGLPVFGGLALGIGYLVYFCDTYGGVFARVFHAQEKGYLQRLPFAVAGYWELVGQSPSGDEVRVVAKLSFSAGATPKKALVEETIRKFQEGFHGGDAGKSSWSEEGLTVKSHKLSAPFYGNKRSRLRSSGELHSWAKAFLQQVAQPLHKAYPLEQVSFSRL